MTTKKYYWLKLDINFYDREEIQLIESMPNGYKYTNFYIKLLLKSANSEGRLRFKDVIPYTVENLATITRMDVDTVKNAVDIFLGLGLMQKLDDKTLFMIETQNMIGFETEWARKKREYREKKKIEMLEDNTRTKKDNVRQEKEIEERDREKEIEKEIEERDREKEIEERDREKEIEEEEKTHSHTHSDEFKQKYSNFLKQVATATSTTFHYVKQALNHSMIISQFDKYIEEFEKSDFLQGKKENKPVIKNFNSIDRVLSGAYRNYSKKAEIDVENYYSDDNDIDDIL